MTDPPSQTQHNPVRICLKWKGRWRGVFSLCIWRTRLLWPLSSPCQISCVSSPPLVISTFSSTPFSNHISGHIMAFVNYHVTKRELLLFCTCSCLLFPIIAHKLHQQTFTETVCWMDCNFTLCFSTWSSTNTKFAYIPMLESYLFLLLYFLYVDSPHALTNSCNSGLIC